MGAPCKLQVQVEATHVVCLLWTGKAWVLDLHKREGSHKEGCKRRWIEEGLD